MSSKSHTSITVDLSKILYATKPLLCESQLSLCYMHPVEKVFKTFFCARAELRKHYLIKNIILMYITKNIIFNFCTRVLLSIAHIPFCYGLLCPFCPRLNRTLWPVDFRVQKPSLLCIFRPRSHCIPRRLSKLLSIAIIERVS